MNSYYCMTREEAENTAQRLRDTRIGQWALNQEDGPSTTMIVTDYRVDRCTSGWGIIERWRYVDRPDLPEFGGAFMPLSVINRLLADNTGRP